MPHTDASKDKWGKPLAPVHDPMPGDEGDSIEPGGQEGAPSISESTEARPGKISREAAQEGLPATPDPDDPASD